MKRPLVTLTIIFCFGIYIASRTKIPFYCAYGLSITCLALSALVLKKGLRFDIFLSGAIFFLGLGLFRNAAFLPPCHIKHFISYKNHQCIIKGIVASQPQQVTDEKSSFILSAQTIQFGNTEVSCCGDIQVYIKSKDVAYGETLVVKGTVHRPFQYPRPERSQYRNYLYARGIYFVLHAEAFKREQSFIRPNVLKKAAFYLKSKIEGVFFRYLPSVPASVLDAMVLGEKKNIPPLLYTAMIKSGTVHILVVSGFNVGLVTLIITFCLKVMRFPRRGRLMLAIPILILYCFMTGVSPPVVRATIMAGVFVFSYVFRREYDIHNACAIALVCIVGFNPRQLFDIGFQLSFASVISIISLYPHVRSWLGVGRIHARCARYLAESSLVSFSAWIGTMPFIFYYFRIFSPITVLANLAIIPLATLITFCGFSLVGMGLISLSLASPFACACEFLVTILIKLNAWLISLPGAYAYFS